MYPNRKLSYSSIKQFAESPRHYLAYLDKKFVQTDSMLLGSVFEDLVCKTYNDKYALFEKPEPSKTMATKANKEAFKQFKEDNEGKTIIKSEMLTEAHQMQHYCEAYLKECGVVNIESDLQKYVSGKVYDLDFHGYIDFVYDGCIYDIKTTNNPLTTKGINNAILKFNYHIQAAVYCIITGIDKYRLLFQSNKAPYCTQIVELSADWIAYGKDKLEEYCEQFNTWLDIGAPDSGREFTQGYILELDLPAWL